MLSSTIYLIFLSERIYKEKKTVSLLGGLTQVLQKMMLVVRPKINQAKVFVLFFTSLFFDLPILILHRSFFGFGFCIASNEHSSIYRDEKMFHLYFSSHVSNEFDLNHDS